MATRVLGSLVCVLVLLTGCAAQMTLHGHRLEDRISQAAGDTLHLGMVSLTIASRTMRGSYQAGHITREQFRFYVEDVEYHAIAAVRAGLDALEVYEATKSQAAVEQLAASLEKAVYWLRYVRGLLEKG